MAHENVLISVGAKGSLLLDDGVGDVLVIENVVLVLASGVYLVLITPVARAVLRMRTSLSFNPFIIFNHFDNILIITKEDRWTFSTFFQLNCIKLKNF